MSHSVSSAFVLALLAFTSAHESSQQGAFGGQDDASLLQQPVLPGRSDAVEEVPSQANEPFLIGLRRESVPVYRRGKVASFKTSYSGVINVGTPAQEFRVVFDTGSGNIVLPASECKSEACLVPDRRRFNMTASSTAVAINEDGSEVAAGEPCDSVTIGFGTGEITGEFTRDRVCFGSPPAQKDGSDVVADAEQNADDDQPVDAVSLVKKDETEYSELCVEMNVILAVEMSSQPFKTFRFDGILGLALDSLAMSKSFSAFEMMTGTGLPHNHFGVFLTEGEDGEESEIAMGGVDERRLLEPISWAPVVMPELGYWQVPILAVRVNGVELDVCKDGTCRGVADTGTSHLGVPAPHDQELAELLTREAGDLLDCRLVDAPLIEIEIPGYNMTLHPFNYMRRLPLREGVSVSSAQGVHVPDNETNKTAANATAANVSEVVPAAAPTGQAPLAVTEAAAPAVAAPAAQAPVGEAAASTGQAPASFGESEEEVVRRFCRPRLMPVRLPAPVGPKLFILGEPLLHRYYSVYDQANKRVGFSLANNRRNTMDPSEMVQGNGVLPQEVDMLLMQQSVTVKKEGGSIRSEDIEEEVALVQMTVKLRVRTRRA